MKFPQAPYAVDIVVLSATVVQAQGNATIPVEPDTFVRAESL
jgi:hypothetical protein